jgi:hypothetical protein
MLTVVGSLPEHIVRIRGKQTESFPGYHDGSMPKSGCTYGVLRQSHNLVYGLQQVCIHDLSAASGPELRCFSFRDVCVSVCARRIATNIRFVHHFRLGALLV